MALLIGVTHYLDEPDTWVVPTGITGTEDLFPIGDETLHPGAHYRERRTSLRSRRAAPVRSR